MDRGTRWGARLAVRTVLACSVLLIAWLPSTALACGMPLQARIPSEQALISFADGREEIITSLHLQSDGPGAAVIFPVPGVPEVSVLESQDLFSYLAEVTRPEVRVEERIVWHDMLERGPMVGAPPGVEVLGHEVIGGYSVARLAAEDTNALQAWLDENGYRVPPNAAPILQAYIDDGWRFVAVKLAPDQIANGALSPLRVAFDSQEIVYPMRLGALASDPLDVLLYVVADHRVEIAELETHYAGPVAQLDQPPPAELAPVFRAPYLTKLRNVALDPKSLTADLVAKPAASDEPFRQVEVHTVYVSGWSRLALPIAGLVLVVLTSAIALGIAFGLRRRMDAIAGPGPERDDDGQ